jgi:hypothetical protein
MKFPKKGFFRLVHLEAIAILIVYFIVSNFILVVSVANANIYISFFAPLLFGVLSTFVFLYLFDHNDFFHFIINFEKEEKGNEKKYLDRFKHFGKIIICILISAIGGPIFLALTVRFLFSESKNRYLIALISTLISTTFSVAFAKGIFGIIFK